MKKESIRLFVSEEELKFYLYLLKFSQLLKNVEEKTSDEISSQHLTDVNKRLNLINKDIEKTPLLNTVAHKALELNKIYVKSWKPLLSTEEVHLLFNTKKDAYIKFIENKIKNENLEKDKTHLEFIKSVELKSTSSKERFGEILLLMIKNMATMPSFSSYTDNWKTDFYSNAAEKTLLYAKNFDEELLSKRTGEKSKAFAYITQICYNAFVNVINIRKSESDFLKATISFESSKIDAIKHHQFFGYSEKEDDVVNSICVAVSSKDDIKQVVKEFSDKIVESNEIFKNNKEINDEILYLTKITKNKNDDFYSYLEELKNNLKISKFDKEINELVLEKETNFIIPLDFYLDSRSFVVSIKSKKEKKKKEEVLVQDDFLEEWFFNE